MDPSTLTEIFLLILALVIAWIIVRFLLRLTMRIFSCGCSLIILLGVLLLILNLSGVLQLS
jgi:hypothetical protein